ncbi:MAG: PKD domain-containing protein [Bacteroidetes bacterium]|nr:PKD domain-containing protein [Bacteroidota bacterium]
MRNILAIILCLIIFNSCKKLSTPAAGFTYKFIKEKTVEFKNISDGGKTYLWGFGDGTASTLENPTHVYLDTGLYLISLSVKNTFGKDIKKNLIKVSLDYIPPFRIIITVKPNTPTYPGVAGAKVFMALSEDSMAKNLYCRTMITSPDSNGNANIDVRNLYGMKYYWFRASYSSGGTTLSTVSDTFFRTSSVTIPPRKDLIVQ